MWTKNTFRGLQSTTGSVDPYVDYAATYHNQTLDYSGHTGDSLNITYAGQTYYGGGTGVVKNLV